LKIVGYWLQQHEIVEDKDKEDFKSTFKQTIKLEKLPKVNINLIEEMGLFSDEELKEILGKMKDTEPTYESPDNNDYPRIDQILL
jgi:hypothetical protein